MTPAPESPLVDPRAPHEPIEAEGAPRVAKRITSFTRRGRRLSARLEAAMSEHASAYLLDAPRAAGETLVHPDWRLDVERVYGRRAPLIVEVGSGHGEQIVTQAATYPENDYLALEVWGPGIARTVEYAADEGVTNLRVLAADAAIALETALEPGSVCEVWTFFPDPWRKNRHHKRRLVQVPFAETIARLLEDGGHWRLATDWADYAVHMREVLRAAPWFAPAPEDSAGGHPTWAGADAWSERYPLRIMTHFEARGARAGRAVRDLDAVRVSRAQEPDPEPGAPEAPGAPGALGATGAAGAPDVSGEPA